jgi:hypothetical protein
MWATQKGGWTKRHRGGDLSDVPFAAVDRLAYASCTAGHWLFFPPLPGVCIVQMRNYVKVQVEDEENGMLMFKNHSLPDFGCT